MKFKFPVITVTFPKMNDDFPHSTIFILMIEKTHVKLWIVIAKILWFEPDSELFLRKLIKIDGQTEKMSPNDEKNVWKGVNDRIPLRI